MSMRLKGLPVDLYVEENQRVESHVDAAEAVAEGAQTKFQALGRTMVQALELCENAERAYLRANEEIRRLMNQVIWSDIKAATTSPTARWRRHSAFGTTKPRSTPSSRSEA